MEAVWPLFIHLAPPSGGYDREEEKQHISAEETVNNACLM